MQKKAKKCMFNFKNHAKNDKNAKKKQDNFFKYEKYICKKGQK